MNEKLQGLIQTAIDNPKTTLLGIIAAAVVGAGQALSAYHVEPFGVIVTGVGGVLVLVTGVIGRDKPKE